MDNQEFINRLQSEFGTGIGQIVIRKPTRLEVQARRDILPGLARWLSREEGFRFIIASGTDTGNEFEIVYHFSYDPAGLVLNVQVLLPYDKPEIQSLTPVITAANWIEREMHELLGIRFLNHPNPEPFLSQGNWDPDEFPYAKPR